MVDLLNHIVLPIALVFLGAALSYANSWRMSSHEHINRIADEATAERDQLKTRITEMERQLSVLGSTVQPLSLAFQTMLVKQLTHMHTPELDALLAKLGPVFTLSEADETRLLAMLIEREQVFDSAIGDSERDAAHMLPMVIKRVRADAGAVPSLEKAQVVIGTAKDEKTGLQKLVLRLVAADLAAGEDA